MRAGHFLLGLLVSAGLPPLQAAGKVSPKPGVAILVNEWNSHITISQLDGREDGLRGHGNYELTPGSHTIRVWLYYTKGRVEVSGKDPHYYSFEAKAGMVIETVCEEKVVSTSKGTWSVWFKDQSTGESVPSHWGGPTVDQVAQGAEVSKNFEATLRLAESGDLDAQYQVALLYGHGYGAVADPVKEMLWYRKAAEGGHARSAYVLGLAYDQGDGLPQEPAEAYVWLSVAAERGDPGAPYYRDELAKKLAPEILAKADARRVELLKGMPQPAP